MKTGGELLVIESPGQFACWLSWNPDEDLLNRVLQRITGEYCVDNGRCATGDSSES